MKKRLILMVLAMMIFLTYTYVFAAVEPTETGYRVKPLQDKLDTMTAGDIDTCLSKFTDIGEHWSRDYVGKLIGLEILAGYGDGTIKPDGKLKIDEFIKMTVCALGFKVEREENYWAEPFIQIAKEQKLIGENEFTDYKREITREKMAEIAYLAAMLKEPAPGNELDKTISMNIVDFTDIDDGKKQYVISSYRLGLMCGNPDGTFKPKSSLTRAEAAAVIIRLLAAKERTPFDPASSYAIELNNYAKERVLVGDNYYEQDAQTYVICRPDKKDEIKTANVLKNSLSKSKGYGHMVYNPGGEGVIGGTFCESKERYLENALDIQMGFGIDIGNSDHSYNMIVYQPGKVKELHMDIVVELFKSLFEADSEKVLAVFDKYVELGVSESIEAMDETYTFNTRKVRIYKLFGDYAFTLWIYSKEQ